MCGSRDTVADQQRTHPADERPPSLSPADMNKDEYESLPTNSVAVHMTAGAVAGIMEHCVMYPFDSVKVSSAIIRAAHPRFHPPALLHNLLAAAGGALPVGHRLAPRDAINPWDFHGIPSTDNPGKVTIWRRRRRRRFSSMLSWNRPSLGDRLVTIYLPQI